MISTNGLCSNSVFYCFPFFLFSFFFSQAQECEAVGVRFHAVYDKLSQALDDLPYNDLGISDEVKEQVIFASFLSTRSTVCS